MEKIGILVGNLRRESFSKKLAAKGWYENS